VLASYWLRSATRNGIKTPENTQDDLQPPQIIAKTKQKGGIESTVF
jgi:hypothetical protein